MLLLLFGDIETCPGPTLLYNDLNNLLKFKGFTVVHQNIRGLFSKKRPSQRYSILS